MSAGWKWARCRWPARSRSCPGSRAIRSRDSLSARSRRNMAPRSRSKGVASGEDVTPTGDSALKAVEAVRDAGGEVVLVFTMVDRDEGAAETFAQAGLPFRSLYKAGEFLEG